MLQFLRYDFPVRSMKKSVPASKSSDNPVRLQIKIRLNDGVIGPGKIELLTHLAEEGSITAAARKMSMNYRRAWHLINTLEIAIGVSIVETEIGGAGGGGARLTEFGTELVDRFQEMRANMEKVSVEFTDWLESSIHSASE